jgi:hypothetical protein
MKDRVIISDSLELSSMEPRVAPPKGHDPVLIEGFLTLVCRERGKIVPGTRREGKNIWTLTGREYLARLMSYSVYGVTDIPARNDRIRYIGFGTGVGLEVSSVAHLVTPTPFNASGGGQFLAELAIPTYPFQTSVSSFGTAVRYTREFSESEISISGSVTIAEAGLFTDGSPDTGFAPKTRDLSLTAALSQAPAAYKSFDPFKKTQNFVLQASWEVRF